MQKLTLIAGLLVVAMLSMAGCDSSGPKALSPEGDPPRGQGVEGVVYVGPMCAEMQANDSCEDVPYEATISVLGQGLAELIRFETDGQGRFRIALEPGTYVLRPEPGAGGLILAEEQLVTVTDGEFLQVQIVYDAGVE